MKAILSGISSILMSIPVVGVFLWFGLVLAALIGWVLNIIKAFGPLAAVMDGTAELYGILVLRIIGIFLGPLGAILGWM